MKFSCGMPPGPRAVEYAKLAEDLGYDRVWLYDSAAIYEDIWVGLAEIGHATDRIGLGTAVLVPNLRHVMATASAIATIERIAPGRLACAFGTGFTARNVLDQPPLTWAELVTYFTQLRGLLAGSVVEIDGRRCQMIHHPDLAAPRPIHVPLLLSAMGPKGQGIARDIADGVMHVAPVPGFDWSVQMINGTVLDDGESVDAPRVQEAAGPWYVLMYHVAYPGSPESVDGLPAGSEWRTAIEDERPEGERHLAVHYGHATHVVDHDRPLIDVAGEAIAGFGWVGTPGEIRERAEGALAGGATEILYTPAGPDIPRELTAFAQAVGG